MAALKTHLKAVGSAELKLSDIVNNPSVVNIQ